MDFVRSQFGKMQLWIIEHFFLHKKVPVVMNHYIRLFQMLWFISTGTFLWRVAFFQREFFTKSILDTIDDNLFEESLKEKNNNSLIWSELLSFLYGIQLHCWFDENWD